MTRKIEGLWLGGALSVEAAEAVEAGVLGQYSCNRKLSPRARAELIDLANAIRAQIQKAPHVPEPVSDLW